MHSSCVRTEEAILLRKKSSVYFDDNRRHINILCVQSVVFMMLGL